MAVRIASLWEVGWNTPVKEFDQWNFALSDFGVERFYMAPVSGIACGSPAQVHERADIGEAIAECRADGFDIVFLDEAGPSDLHTFAHPANALYVFGRTSLSVGSMAQPGDTVVSIVTPGATGPFWGHQAACLVLYDRQVKSWP